MNIAQWIKMRIVIWKFEHGMGNMTRQYRQLSQQMERCAFLMEKFGRAWRDVLDDEI